MKEKKALVTAVLLGIAVFIFYLATLSPTVLWGDDAFFQWSTAAGYLQADGGGHWLHFILARLFIKLPFGDIAYRVNLLSAAAGTVTIVLIFACGRSLQLSNTAALAGALSLTVAHTFWTHAVRAEVYTVFTMFLALILWLLLRWREERVFALYTAAFLISPAMLSHQMMLLLLPTFAFFIWPNRARLNRKKLLITGIAFISGALLALSLIQTQVNGQNITDSLLIFFTRSGADFRDAFFDFTLQRLISDIAFWLALLALQFVGPALLFVYFGFNSWRKKPKILWPLLIFYGMTVLFAISYRVNDRFVFFIPGYLIIALLVGKGWQTVWEKRSNLAQTVLPLLVIVPILTYALLPSLLHTVSLPLPTIRELPGREPASFFLWPAKKGYQGAADFGRSALNNLPPNAVLLADHTPYETLNYYQKVELLRLDVLLIKVESHTDLGAVIKTFEKKQPIYLADNNPAYYNLSSLQLSPLTRTGVIYKLENDQQ